VIVMFCVRRRAQCTTWTHAIVVLCTRPPTDTRTTITAATHLMLRCVTFDLYLYHHHKLPVCVLLATAVIKYFVYYLRQEVLRSVVFVGWLVRVFENMCWGRSRISRKLLEMEARLQWNTYRKWHMANPIVRCRITSRDPER